MSGFPAIEVYGQAWSAAVVVAGLVVYYREFVACAWDPAEGEPVPLPYRNQRLYDDGAVELRLHSYEA